MKHTIYKVVLLAAIVLSAVGCAEGTVAEEPVKAPAPIAPVVPVKPTVEQPPAVPSANATAAEKASYFVVRRAYCVRHPSLAYCR